MDISPELITELITALIALVAAITAVIKNRQANTAQAQVQALTPGTVESRTTAIVATLPERSYKMSDITKRWLTFDATPENKTKILQQVDAAEQQHLTQYQIRFDGGYYNIEYGLLAGSTGNPHDTG